MNKYLKIILMSIIMALSFSSVNLIEASQRTISPPYEEYYQGNQDLVIVSGRQGVGWFVDLSSIYVIKNDQQGVEFEVNTFSVNFNTENREMRNITPIHYFKSYAEPNSIFYVGSQYKDYGPIEWHRGNLTNHVGTNESMNNTFIYSMERITGKEYRY